MIGMSILQGTEEHVYSVVDKSKKKKKTSLVCCYTIYVCHYITTCTYACE